MKFLVSKMTSACEPRPKFLMNKYIPSDKKRNLFEQKSSCKSERLQTVWCLHVSFTAKIRHKLATHLYEVFDFVFKSWRKALVFLLCSCVFDFANENARTLKYNWICFSSKFILVSLSILQEDPCSIALKALITSNFPVN